MADIPDSHNKKVARILHDQGVEVTPEEVVTARREAFAKIRESLARRGIEAPEGDLELLRWMRALGVGQPKECPQCGGPMVHSRLKGYHCFKECGA